MDELTFRIKRIAPFDRLAMTVDDDGLVIKGDASDIRELFRQGMDEMRWMAKRRIWDLTDGLYDESCDF